jgi:hypothetical protein
MLLGWFPLGQSNSSLRPAPQLGENANVLAKMHEDVSKRAHKTCSKHCSMLTGRGQLFLVADRAELFTAGALPRAKGALRASSNITHNPGASCLNLNISNPAACPQPMAASGDN